MSLTVTAAPVYVDSPCVQVTVSSSPTLTAPLVVYRVHEDGTRYRVLMTANPMLVGSWSGFDFHAPFNEDVTYTAAAAGLVSAASGVAWLSSDDTTWLIHPTEPALSFVVDQLMGPSAPYVYPTRSQSYQVIGRRLPVTRTDFPRAGERGQLVVKCETRESRDALKALLADDGPILLNSPYASDDLGWKWVQFGDLTISNPGGFLSFPFRYATLPYTETTQPDADQAPVWTYDDLKAAALTSSPTYTNLHSAGFATYDALKLNIH